MDDVYLARKGNFQHYIQPDMLEEYAEMGYTIMKLEPVVVTDIQKEIEEMEPNEASGTIEGVNSGEQN